MRYFTTSTLVVKYLYDPWGKPVRVTDQRDNAVTDEESIALRNPFRYRGYYYDTDTGWYYLNSRYYDPETGRFINADGYASTGQGFVGNNMFAYCNNNPVMMKDSTGSAPVYACSDNCYFPDRMSHSIDTCRMLRLQKLKYERHHTNELRICTDGAENNYKSQSHKSETAMSGRLGALTPADTIPYIVIPTNHPQYDELIGCMGVVINNQNGNFVYAVVGDGGPAKNGFGEVSLKAAWDLGFSKEEANGSCGPEGDFTIVVYPGTRQQWTSNDLYNQIQAAGSRLYP